MTAPRRAILLGIVGWMGVQITLALLMLDQSRDPLFTLAVMLGGCCVIVMVIWPLLPPRTGGALPRAERGPANAWLLAASVPVLQLLALLPLEPGAITGYANWPGNALGLLLAALLVRRRTALAIGAGAVQVWIQWAMYAAQPGPAGFQLSSALLLMVPVPLWLGVGWGVRRELSRSDRIVGLYLDRAASDHETASVHVRRQVVSKDWFTELSADVLPLLHDVIAADDPSSPALRARAEMLARSARDSLRARALLDPSVTSAIRSARDRGATVRLNSEVPADSPDAARVRQIAPLVVALLHRPSLESLVVHVSQDPLELIATARLPQGEERWIDELLQLPGWSFVTARIDDELILRGQPQP